MTNNAINWNDVPPCITATAIHARHGRVYRVGHVWVKQSGEPFDIGGMSVVTDFQCRDELESRTDAERSLHDDVYRETVRAMSSAYMTNIVDAFSESYAVVQVSQMSVPGYESLAKVLKRAYEQAAIGKGKERHAGGQPFHEQPMQQISDLLDDDAGMAFQACKKIHESRGLEHDAKIRELLGAINYIAGMVIWHERNHTCAEAQTQRS